MKKVWLGTLVSALLLTPSAYAFDTQTCLGDMYGVNNKGAPKLFKLNQSLTSVDSQADTVGTSAALAYNPLQNRLYYVTRPVYGNSQLVYVDLSDDSHHVVGNTQHSYRLTFSPDGQTLYGSSGKKLFTYDLNTAEATFVGTLSGFPFNVDSKMGDIAFVGDDMYFVSKKRIFKVDLTTLTVTNIGKHKITHVNGAEFGGDGKLILSKAMGQKSKLFEYDLATNTKRFLGKVNARLNDLALDTSACDMPTEVTVDTITADKNQVDEGDVVDYTVTFTGPTPSVQPLNLGFVANGTKVKVDFSSLLAVSYDGGITWPRVYDTNPSGVIQVPQGVNAVTFRVLTLVDGRDPGESIEFQAWMTTDQTDLGSIVTPIVDRDNDPTLDGQYIADMMTLIPSMNEGDFTETKIELIRTTDRNTPMHIQFINESAKKAQDINQEVFVSYANDHQDYYFELDLLDFKVLNLPEGISELTVRYQALQDDIVDCNETFSFASWIVGQGTDYFRDQISIIDTSPQCSPDPIHVGFSLAPVVDTVTEGETAVFEVTLDEELAVDASVTVTAIAGTADTEDYQLATYELVVPAGYLTADIEIPTFDDSDYEQTESFTLNVAAAINTSGSHSLPVTIEDNDPVPTSAFTVEVIRANVTEGQTAQFVIHLDQALDVDATVNVSAVAGSATSADFTFTDQELTIAAGDTVQHVDIPTVNDTSYEGTETFTFRVDAGANTNGSISNVVTITDNDPAPQQCMTVSGNGLSFAPGLNVRVDHIRHALDGQRFIFKKNGANQTGYIYPTENQWNYLGNVSGGNTYTVFYQFDKSNRNIWQANECRARIIAAGHGEIQCDDIFLPSWDDTIVKFTYSSNGSCQ
ncbi:Calx-beta domain-containing protein [Shewanella sp. NIFS-20-20]|uniref:Calx-beta domain-containing protein n=1 Tax=Shewanella sp. NIFS-20-20 TaxID=2853806 RepID=UPI001C466B31|nr:Calx-beta domain-containing protein [Shewanella sp. NIFS-20-20]MBV7315685.1 hypothetical protein [Shewanella sp. NIFS-20-20]